MRRAEPDDGASIQALVERAFSVYIERIGRRPPPMDTDYSPLIEAGTVWVDGDPIDAVLALRAQPPIVWIELIAVDPDRQHSGIGGRLMTAAEGEAAGRGADEIRLYTHRLMTENHDFYARRGYQPYESNEPEPVPRVHFRKRLAGRSSD